MLEIESSIVGLYRNLFIWDRIYCGLILENLYLYHLQMVIFVLKLVIFVKLVVREKRKW